MVRLGRDDGGCAPPFLTSIRQRPVRARRTRPKTNNSHTRFPRCRTSSRERLKKRSRVSSGVRLLTRTRSMGTAKQSTGATKWARARATSCETACRVHVQIARGLRWRGVACNQRAVRVGAAALPRAQEHGETNVRLLPIVSKPETTMTGQACTQKGAIATKKRKVRHDQRSKLKKRLMNCSLALCAGHVGVNLFLWAKGEHAPCKSRVGPHAAEHRKTKRVATLTHSLSHTLSHTHTITHTIITHTITHTITLSRHHTHHTITPSHYHNITQSQVNITPSHHHTITPLHELRCVGAMH
jgi:hypothetical protein